MEQFIASTVTIGMPLLFAGIAGLLAERTGVLNIGLEGLMLGGAFAAAWAGGGDRPPELGFLAAIGFGLLAGLLLGWIKVVLRGDQVVVGIAFNLFILGLTGYLFTIVTGGGDTRPVSTISSGVVRIPVLADIPWFGIVFEQHWIAYLGYALVPVTSFMLFSTGVGIRLRACGEYAEGALASGVNVVRARVLSMAVSGLIAAAGGAYLVLADTHVFGINMTNGRGYIALVVIILGRWMPLGALGAAALFGASQFLEFHVQTRDLNLPLQLVAAIPYLIVLVSVAVFGARVRPPTEEGKPLMISK